MLKKKKERCYLVSFLHRPCSQLPDGFLCCVTKTTLRDRKQDYYKPKSKWTAEYENRPEKIYIMSQCTAVYWGERHTKRKRHKETKTQRDRDTKRQRHKDKATQRDMLCCPSGRGHQNEETHDDRWWSARDIYFILYSVRQVYQHLNST